MERLELRLAPVASGLAQPLWVTNAGDGSGRLFVIEQPGRVRVIRDGKLAEKPFIDVSRQVAFGGERGLLGMAFSPQYKTNGRFYLNYTDTDGNTRIVRYTAQDPSSDSPAFSAPELVLKVGQPYPNHNGGCTIFGPDGRLYVGMGDGGSAGDPQNRAQNDSSLLGKLLAIDVENDPGAKPTIVAKGLRNPWRFSFDSKTGDLWIGDVGQNSYEEIDFVEAGNVRPLLNFGWNLWEGNHPYPQGASRSRAGFTFPVIEHPRNEAQCITGGYVYRGSINAAMEGAYIYGDFSAGWIGAARREGGAIAHRIVMPNAGIAVSSFGEGEDGEIYVCSYSGSVARIESPQK